jgi:hypothetical protein
MERVHRLLMQILRRGAISFADLIVEAGMPPLRLHRVLMPVGSYAGIIEAAVADLMRPVGFRPETTLETIVLKAILNIPKFRPNIGQKTNT